MTRLLAPIVVAMLVLALGAGARAFDRPTGSVILSVTGDISESNSPGGAAFDRAMLEALPQHGFETGTPWTDGVRSFRGPLLRDVLDAVGAKGATLRIVALDDYASEVPASDARDFDPILTLWLDDKKLRVRDKGPLWLVYPYDHDPALANDTIYKRSVSQIKSIEVR